jgi:acyl-CoA thioester hydrolase
METEAKIAHRLKIKIYYEDTDAGGVVYYANYLRYLERARTEFLLEKGINVAEYHNKGYLFAVVHVDINYKRPAKLGEIIEVTTEVVEMTNATITLKHEILRVDTLLIEANVKVACITKDGKPQRLPDSFKSLNL